MVKNKNAYENNYDSITVVYDSLVRFFSLNRINKSQEAFLSHLSTQKTALIIGGGTGCFLQQLLEQNSEINITYVDISAKMIDFATKRIATNSATDLERVTFICERIQDFEWQSYDVIVCNYILDLFDEELVNDLVIKFRKNLTMKGLLYVTDFSISEKNVFMKYGTQIGLTILYTFFRWITDLQTSRLANSDQIIKSKDFKVLDSKEFLNGILQCRLYKLL